MDQQKPASPYKGGRIDGWPKGMDNRRSDVDVPSDTLRNAVNVNILTSGKVRMRQGLVQRIADANAHSAFSDNDRIVWATPTTLKFATPNLVKATIKTDPNFAYPLSYVDLNGEIYFSNEFINGKIDSSNAYVPWGIVPPTVAPVCTAMDVPAGRLFQVTCTFVLASGEESGAPMSVVVTCGDSPSIRLTSIPQSSDSRVVATRIYVSDVNDENMYAEVNVPAGVTTTTLQGPFGKGEILKTQFMIPPPPGQLIDYFDGKLYIASGNIVWVTEPLRYNLVNLSNPLTVHGFIPYPERVTLLRAVDDGLYVSADTTYFLKGGLTKDIDQQPLLPYKAIEGAVCNIPSSKDVMWLSERGFVIGKSSGAAVNVTEDRLAIDVITRACMGIIETNGVKSAVAIAKEIMAVSPLAASEYVAGESDRIADIV